MTTKILIIDHKDSFTYNLVQLFEEAGVEEAVVMPIDEINFDEINNYDGIVLSPGPGLPKDYPASFVVLEKYVAVKSILGVCLGLQIIVEYFGGELYNLKTVQHGRQVKVFKVMDSPLFEKIKFPLKVGLYHSWAMKANKGIGDLQTTSITENKTIMSLKHAHYKVFGVQFHPEKSATAGEQILKNFIEL